jgi:5-formyltetrahydrofolate cyclo-ligase|tara:strand:- start:1108 stop:1431 length:324 start_codon:yes stop_codon:yes gene_type:complete
MNSINEKEKKLNIALEELKNLDLTNPDLQNNIENLNFQKNQLEIEKLELENKYKELIDENNNLSKKLAEIQNNEKNEKRKQIEFSEKIDELNQETDTLLEEIDKWQM